MEFIDIFTSLCNRDGKSPSAVCRDVGLSNSTYTYWRTSKATPRMAVLAKLADYFSVPLEYLKTGDEALLEAESELDGLRFALYGDPAKDVTKEDLQDVIDFAKYVRQRRKDKN